MNLVSKYKRWIYCEHIYSWNELYTNEDEWEGGISDRALLSQLPMDHDFLRNKIYVGD